MLSLYRAARKPVSGCLESSRGCDVNIGTLLCRPTSGRQVVDLDAVCFYHNTKCFAINYRIGPSTRQVLALLRTLALQRWQGPMCHRREKGVIEFLWEIISQFGSCPGLISKANLAFSFQLGCVVGSLRVQPSQSSSSCRLDKTKIIGPDFLSPERSPVCPETYVYSYSGRCVLYILVLPFHDSREWHYTD